MACNRHITGRNRETHMGWSEVCQSERLVACCVGATCGMWHVACGMTLWHAMGFVAFGMWHVGYLLHDCLALDQAGGFPH